MIIAFKAAKTVTLRSASRSSPRATRTRDLFLQLTLALHLPLSARLLDRAIALLSTLIGTDLLSDFVDPDSGAGSESQTAGSIAVSVARTRLLLCNGQRLAIRHE